MPLAGVSFWELGSTDTNRSLDEKTQEQCHTKRLEGQRSPGWTDLQPGAFSTHLVDEFDQVSRLANGFWWPSSSVGDESLACIHVPLPPVDQIPDSAILPLCESGPWPIAIARAILLDSCSLSGLHLALGKPIHQGEPGLSTG